MWPEVNLPPLDRECIKVSSKSKIRVFCGGFLANNGRGGPVLRGYFVRRNVDELDGEVGDFTEEDFGDFDEYSLNSRIRMDLRGAVSSPAESPWLIDLARAWWECGEKAVELDTAGPSSLDGTRIKFLTLAEIRSFPWVDPVEEDEILSSWGIRTVDRVISMVYAGK